LQNSVRRELARQTDRQTDRRTDIAAFISLLCNQCHILLTFGVCCQHFVIFRHEFVYLHKTSQAGPWYRRSVAGRSSRRFGCAIRSVVCGIHGGQSGTGQVFLRALQLSAVSISPPVHHTHFSFLLSECLHMHASFLLSVCLHQCPPTGTSVFCCQYVSTIAPHAHFFCCQYVSTSSPHAF